MNIEELEAMPSDEVERRLADAEFRRKYGRDPIAGMMQAVKYAMANGITVVELYPCEVEKLMGDNEFQRLSQRPRPDDSPFCVGRLRDICFVETAGEA